MLNRKALPHSLVAALAIEVRSLSRAGPSIRSGRRAIALQLFPSLYSWPLNPQYDLCAEF
jgi:hypothetical protein